MLNTLDKIKLKTITTLESTRVGSQNLDQNNKVGDISNILLIFILVYFYNKHFLNIIFINLTILIAI